MKTAEELFRDYHTQTSYSLVMYEQNFIEALTEHDAEIVNIIDDMIEKEKMGLNTTTRKEIIGAIKIVIYRLEELKIILASNEKK